MKILNEAVPEELEGEGHDASHEKELIQEMLGEVNGMELSQIGDVGGRDETSAKGYAVPDEGRSSAAGSLLSEGEAENQQLQEYQLQFLRRSHQTGKGKMASWYCLTVVGNGSGLVGLGEGKSTQGEKVREYAVSEAKRNMDYVDRFENRTLWTEMQGKFGGARLIMRPRPVGFGLMCAPGIHQVLKAAGIKDCSAKLWGSRNKIVSVKLAIKMLHAGHQPLYFGNGSGGRGIRLEKGKGMRNKTEVERERGRRIIDARL
ncbi:MAG TPA: hypothetical protein VGO47_06485, partial [Chlamydiales bacterium]|nr:hypothetical protein [Chlamydiales bacterium]